MFAADADSGSNGAVRYAKLQGEEEIVKHLRLDPDSGEITMLKGDIFDREDRQSESNRSIFEF